MLLLLIVNKHTSDSGVGVGVAVGRVGGAKGGECKLKLEDGGVGEVGWWRGNRVGFCEVLYWFGKLRKWE